jgi:hypothetical protein
MSIRGTRPWSFALPAGLLILAAIVLLAGVPAVAQDKVTPAARTTPLASADPTQLPLVSGSGRPDLYLEMPYDIDNYEPRIEITRGRDHFADLAPDDPRRRELEGLLETVAADVEDLVTGYALVSTEALFAFVVAVRVEGATPGTLLPAYLPILLGGLEDPGTTPARLGDKEVLVVSTVGAEGEPAELYVYDEGDTVWIVQAPRTIAESTLADLPAPLAVDPAG